MNCRTCKGAGEVRRYAGKVFGHAHYHLVECEDCDSTGKAKLLAPPPQQPAAGNEKARSQA